MTIVTVELMLATAASNADDDSAASPDTDWECAAAAAEYQHFGNINGVPTSLIEGEQIHRVLQYRHIGITWTNLDTDS